MNEKYIEFRDQQKLRNNSKQKISFAEFINKDQTTLTNSKNFNTDSKNISAECFKIHNNIFSLKSDYSNKVFTNQKQISQKFQVFKK